jgi:aspartyl-tRNA(Asn)/glutamyl-tRNA(Gln) amidotransferase subunit A
MIILGKTHRSIRDGQLGTNTHMGTPRNPWDLAVHARPAARPAARESQFRGLPVAIAPIRAVVTAAWCGIVGLR